VLHKSLPNSLKVTSRPISNPFLAAVIPALNESQNIELLVKQVSQKALTIVVDDGSTDDTARLAKTLALT